MMRGLTLPSIITRLDAMTPDISGSFGSFMRMLEEAFEAGFSAGFHSEENPADHIEAWEEYKKQLDI
jgi:hypothetical protein